MTVMTKVLPAVALLAAMCGCGSDSSDNRSAVGGVQAVTVYDKGAVVPDPTTTTVVITPGKISYLQAQGGRTVSAWTKEIQLVDYLAITKAVTEDQFRPGQSLLVIRNTGCAGSRGMTVSVTRDNTTDSYDIPGNCMCDRELWSPGVREVVGLEETLVTKYR
jgi:hypothetical protein